jgi:hypothetical protein
MTRRTTTVLTGVAVAALAAAAAAAVVNFRLGRSADSAERAHLDELDARLDAVREPGSHTPPRHILRVLESLQRNRGISVGRLRSWINGVRGGTLSPEQTTVAESDFDTLEREADQGGV